jgi:hypothetical protein
MLDNSNGIDYEIAYEHAMYELNGLRTMMIAEVGSDLDKNGKPFIFNSNAEMLRHIISLTR